MLDINLVPPNLKRKKKRSGFPGGLQIPKEFIFGIGGGFVVLLISFNIFLQVKIFVSYFHHKNLKKQWEVSLPSKQNVDTILKELRQLQAKLKSIEELTTAKNILWSQKLNIISDLVPRGLWLKRVALNEDVLFIEGSSLSQKQNEMISIHTFTTGLKDDANFLKNLGEMELGSIQRRKIQQIEIADFLIKTKLP